MTTQNSKNIVKSMEQSMNNIEKSASYKRSIEKLQKEYSEIDKEFKRNYFVFSADERAKTVKQLKEIDSQICEFKKLIESENKKSYETKASKNDFHKDTKVAFGYMSIRRDKNM